MCWISPRDMPARRSAVWRACSFEMTLRMLLLLWRPPLDGSCWRRGGSRRATKPCCFERGDKLSGEGGAVNEEHCCTGKAKCR